ncbi:erythromycin esterase family protein [Streptomyces yaizuensis]|uniref:Uncharacterized protein n=1 Tax=Streptomyces yaizuensis TaxID=2989713 RepID=A0ABQ5P0Y3_9ACTN|nr:erythromycin esterase family protein [Streptomyces sp. YSPA8]GLF96174.1 hypothetical protein SYYSPA8_17775 [Streptomyces sp. YSPA8]
MNDAVSRWIEQRAHVLAAVAPGAPATDPEPLLPIVGGAAVAALGTSIRHSRELSALSHRTVRILVEKAGFRTVLLEGDDPVQTGLDRFIRTGEGDPRTWLTAARPFWRYAGILALVHWMPAWNAVTFANTSGTVVSRRARASTTGHRTSASPPRRRSGPLPEPALSGSLKQE